MYDISQDHILWLPNNKDTVLCYTVLYNDIQGIYFGNHHCNCKISHKSSELECMSNCCRRVQDDHKVKNCKRDSTVNLFSTEFCDSDSTIGDVSFSFYWAKYCLDVQRMVCRQLLFEQIHKPTNNKKNMLLRTSLVASYKIPTCWHVLVSIVWAMTQ